MAYWTNGCYAGASDAGVVRAALDGSGGSRILARDTPRGIALDIPAGRVYWTEDRVSSTLLLSARLDGGDVQEIALGGVAGTGADGLALLLPPAPSAAPTLSGAATIGEMLTCGGASWAADSPEAFAFRAPATSTVQWARDGQPIAGAADATYRVTEAGRYACLTVGTNAAGATTATSDGITVPAAVPTPSTPTVGRLSARWTLRGRSVTTTFRVPAGANRFTITATKRGVRKATRGRCRLTGTTRARSATCTLGLSPGRWTATVTASRGATPVSRTTRAITVRASR